MIELKDIGRVGFGAYRVSDEPAHIEALDFALQNGVNLVDTASTYTHGVSENVIGKALQKVRREDVFVVTKAGYVTEKILNDARALDIPKAEIVLYDESHHHCIHPLFLEQRLDISLSRLNSKYIDGFLLHNPEYYFRSDPNASVDEYLDRVRKAFIFLEECVERGVIRYYGLSSNTLPLPIGPNNKVSFTQIFDVAKSISDNNHFKIVQFPYNFYEKGASLDYGEGSLIDNAKRNRIFIISNRPFNSHINEGTFRIVMDVDKLERESEHRSDPANDFIAFKTWVDSKLSEYGRVERFSDFAVLKYLEAMWTNFQLLSQQEFVFTNHLVPFVEALDESAVENIALKNFYRASRQCTLVNIRRRLDSVKADLGVADEKTLPRALVNSYQNNGIDCVLTGMRSRDYVETVI